MKRISLSLSLLLISVGLFFSLALSAQQYHDAATFGLKGNVKEVKVIHQKTGDLSRDIHGFSELSFGRDGRLERWNHLGEDFIIPDDGREGTLLVHGHHPSEDASADVYFLYDRENSGNQAYGYYEIGHIRFDYLDWLLYGIEDEDAYRVSVLFETADEVLEDRIDFSIPPKYDAKDLIKDALEDGGKILGMDLIRDNLSYYISEEGFEEYKSKLEEYKISARDSHGNYTVLDGKDNQAYSIKRVITYWDESPEGPKQNSSSSKSSSSTASKSTSTTPKANDTPSTVVPKPPQKKVVKYITTENIVDNPFCCVEGNWDSITVQSLLRQLKEHGYSEPDKLEDSSLYSIWEMESHIHDIIINHCSASFDEKGKLNYYSACYLGRDFSREQVRKAIEKIQEDLLSMGAVMKHVVRGKSCRAYYEDKEIRLEYNDVSDNSSSLNITITKKDIPVNKTISPKDFTLEELITHPFGFIDSQDKNEINTILESNVWNASLETYGWDTSFATLTSKEEGYSMLGVPITGFYSRFHDNVLTDFSFYGGEPLSKNHDDVYRRAFNQIHDDLSASGAKIKTIAKKKNYKHFKAQMSDREVEVIYSSADKIIVSLRIGIVLN